MIKITVKNSSEKVVFVTDNKHWRQALDEHRKELAEMWWTCYVEYDDGTGSYKYVKQGYPWPCDRKVVDWNGRMLYARYCFSNPDGYGDFYDRLHDAFFQHFETCEKVVAEEDSRDGLKYKYATSAPKCKTMKPEPTEAIEELLDD